MRELSDRREGLERVRFILNPASPVALSDEPSEENRAQRLAVDLTEEDLVTVQSRRGRRVGFSG